MATGGGRCNITNEACENKAVTLDFFQSLGLALWRDEAGRYYPYSNQASDVVKILTSCLEEKQVELITSFAAAEVRFRDGLFYVSDPKGRTVAAAKLVIAVGGKAAPQFGTTGDGYALAKSFGHHVTKVYPVLTGIRCGDFHDIKGVRARGRASLYRDGCLLASEAGEIQFTEDGISGICVMNLTLHIIAEEGEHLKDALKRFHIELDLAPDFSEKELTGRKSSFGILSERLSKRVGMEQIKCWRLPVEGVKGWKNAQCTGGGVCLSQIDLHTMESKLVPSLYFAGEILNLQGSCGGYNLQNAWETAMKAAAAINQKR